MLTSLAIGVGFVLSSILALLIRARPRCYGGRSSAVTGMLYTIPSLALFALLVPITGLSLLTAEIALIRYTLLILVRNTSRASTGVPRDVLEAADGMGYTRLQRLLRVDAAAGHAADHRRPPDRDRDDDRARDGHRRRSARAGWAS